MKRSATRLGKVERTETADRLQREDRTRGVPGADGRFTDESRRRVVASTFLTLDGYMVGPDEDMSWVVDGFDPEMQDDIAGHMSRESDCFLFGRMTYEIFASYWPTAVPYGVEDELNPAGGREDPRIIGALNGSDKVVFSRTLEAPEWAGTRVVRGDLEAEVRRLKEAPGRGISVQGSASVIQALEHAGLIDEYRIYLHPVLLGKGKPLFTAGADRTDLELISSKRYANGVLGLRYRPRAPVVS
jgi:dihydrofolate reductase